MENPPVSPQEGPSGGRKPDGMRSRRTPESRNTCAGLFKNLVASAAAEVTKDMTSREGGCVSVRAEAEGAGLRGLSLSAAAAAAAVAATATRTLEGWAPRQDGGLQRVGPHRGV